MDYDQAENWADGGGIKVEGDIEVFPGRHVRGKGGIAEEFQGEFRLREELVPQEFGEGIGEAGKDGKEVGFEGADGAFGYVVTICTRRENLENTVPIFNDGAMILKTGLVVKYLEIDTMAFSIEARHVAVVGRNTMAVVV